MASKQARLKAKKSRTPTRYARAKVVAATLTDREREKFIVWLQTQHAKSGRARVIADLQEARRDYANGNYFTGTVEEIVAALNA
jgi:hypothetical protein